mmetsp:Transcript_31893/g.49917  ORF Transcript_31893/g.49917 Transcript_31893/m.49917 type:complete len:547 (-) Transcript_31893:169-1809(-)|eukprot:CAMPEP_0201530854 /NCGR_PEP_ID=MMETSP0161_2-20130828/45907_1 /ASSEMBLY_ACC=CAM_ASM_000251 /TAXON_ID=180227 /ORGANISM="Neoparamoeba aestuarina, Strain SoJaBio B1-5/56/2" /LENGTH=546 /DNA_ID=CAMNT_0047933423 /DNA_START=259 /DNA_END=1899 /DNA_ORIENTATION=-
MSDKPQEKKDAAAPAAEEPAAASSSSSSSSSSSEKTSTTAGKKEEGSGEGGAHDDSSETSSEDDSVGSDDEGKKSSSSSKSGSSKFQKNMPRRKGHWDDDKGDYIIRAGEVWDDRYEIGGILGKGSFGQVVEAYDRVRRTTVAIKIVKSRPAFYNQARVELRILRLLQQKDPYDQFFIVRMIGHFMWRDHLCITFELLSMNLYELLKNTDYQGVSLHLVRKFAQQILTALYFLSEIRVIHCDLKPENVLLRNPKRSAIKVIDFSSSCRVTEKMYTYIQSRFYRAPEVLLELDYDCSVDMWSLGCILSEMHTGEPLFTGRNETEQLQKICELKGLPPPSMILRSPKSRHFFSFTANGFALRSVSDRRKLKRKSLDNILGVHTGGPNGRRLGEKGHYPQDYLKFKDLLERMLAYKASDRATPLECLQHCFFHVDDKACQRGHVSISPSSNLGSHTCDCGVKKPGPSEGKDKDGKEKEKGKESEKEEKEAEKSEKKEEKKGEEKKGDEKEAKKDGEEEKKDDEKKAEENKKEGEGEEKKGKDDAKEGSS